MEMICTKTGLTFEAKSKASKNHPLVSAILAEANKTGVYQIVLSACSEVKATNLSESLAIEFLNSVLNSSADAKSLADWTAVNEKKQSKKEAVRESKLVLNNKSDVMKAAHSFKKEGLTMSQSLTKAWSLYKEQKSTSKYVLTCEEELSRVNYTNRNQISVFADQF
jgi:hypothetical protein